MHSNRLLFLTDSPPLREGATGNHGIAANFADILDSQLGAIVTHRHRRSISCSVVKSSFDVPIEFYPDGGGFGLKRFSPGLCEIFDIAGALLYAGRLRRLVAERNLQRIFALVGANGWYLVTLQIFAKAARLPYELYLVDDLEHWSQIFGRKILSKVIRRLEGFSLRHAAKVHVISPGYADHLQLKYGVTASWLPTPMEIGEFRYRPHTDKTCDLVFVGNLGPLYEPALADIYSAIQKCNRESPSRQLRLKIITPGAAQGLISRLPDSTDLEVISGPNREELRRLCSEAWATILPYSFEDGIRTMVSTSFSWKLSDSYRAGRPILVYGPEYASIPRYWKDANLPLLATIKESLPATIEAIADQDNPDLIARYRETWERLHSPAAIRARLMV
jgi:hypothetical protein